MNTSSLAVDVGTCMGDVLLESIATYDRGAAQFAAQYEGVSADPFIDWLVESIELGASVVDAGCGSGRDTARLAERGFESIGVDCSRGMLREARRLHPRARLLAGDIACLPFGAESVDAVWAMASLVHLDDQEIVTVLAGFHRVLRADAPLFISLPLGDQPTWRECSAGRRWFRYLKQESVEESIVNAGFRIAHSEVTAGLLTGHWINLLAQKF